MIRICYVVGISLPFVIYYLIRISYVEQHGDKYTETVRYQIARNAISILKFNGMIRTDVYGLENLPKDGGYGLRYVPQSSGQIRRAWYYFRPRKTLHHDDR